MKALKCDVCGAYFEIRKDSWNRLAIKEIDKRDYVDICPDCYAAIKKTMDDRRKRGVDPMEDDLK